MELPELSGGAVPRASSRMAAAMALAIAASAFLFAGTAFAEPASEDLFDSVIYDSAQRLSLDPLLVKAVIWNESRFNPRATGSSGEIGLMQLKMGAVKDWARANGRALPSAEEIYDPYLNIEIGVWYLSRAIERWDGHEQCYTLALCEYNAGRSRAVRWLSGTREGADIAIGSSTTKAYVALVRDKYIEYSSMESSSFAGIAQPHPLPLP